MTRLTIDEGIELTLAYDKYLENNYDIYSSIPKIDVIESNMEKLELCSALLPKLDYDEKWSDDNISTNEDFRQNMIYISDDDIGTVVKFYMLMMKLQSIRSRNPYFVYPFVINFDDTILRSNFYVNPSILNLQVSKIEEEAMIFISNPEILYSLYLQFLITQNLKDFKFVSNSISYVKLESPILIEQKYLNINDNGYNYLYIRSRYILQISDISEFWLSININNTELGDRVCEFGRAASIGGFISNLSKFISNMGFTEDSLYESLWEILLIPLMKNDYNANDIRTLMTILLSYIYLEFDEKRDAETKFWKLTKYSELFMTTEHVSKFVYDVFFRFLNRYNDMTFGIDKHYLHEYDISFSA